MAYFFELQQPSNVVEDVDLAVDEFRDELRNINQKIYDNPELRFEEVKACQILSNYMRDQGWKVEVGVYGLKTSFEARFSVGEGGRTVCFNAEYDALPGLGHACGHNLIATSALASAISASAIMKKHKINGTLIIMGTPAEEGGGGKWIMAKHGAWKGVDACLQTHGMNDHATPMCVTRASWKATAKYYGQSAHAAASPWTGVNSCDAIVQAYVGIGLLRQQIAKTESIQGVILEGGKASNIIPSYSEGAFGLRALNMKDLEVLRGRVEPIFHAAAAATGCRLELTWTALYEDVVTNWTLAEQYRQYMLKYYGMTQEEMLPLEEARVKHDQPGSTDFGSCSYISPGVHAVFDIQSLEPPHTIAFREASGTELAFNEAIRAGKVNGLLAVDVLSNDQFATRMKSEFVETMKNAGRWSDEGHCNVIT